MALTFEWDSNKAKSNLEKHQLAFEEAATVFADTNSLTIDDPAHSVNEKRHITLGKSQSKRLLVVVHTERGDKIRIISARLASKKERQQYEQK
jgi:uncharacterized DUF497 family protein